MAGRIKGITVEIGGDVTKLDKALREVNKEINSTQSALRDVERLLKLDPTNITLLAQKHQLLAKAIEDTKKKLETLKEAERQAQEQFQRGEISLEQYQGLQREIVATEQKLKALEKQANIVGEAFKRGLKVAAEATVELAKAAAKGFEAVESVGKKAGETVTAALKGFATAATAVAGFSAAAVKTGMDFDAAMSEVSAISGATGQDFQDLRNKAIDMGEATQFSATEAAEAMTYMGMAGWKTGDMLDGISGIMNLAAASGEDLATTSDIVTDALTAFGMSASESGRFADVLAVAATNANTDVGMMGETFKYMAPVAGAMGYSIEDSAIAIGLMANSSIKASDAGTALRSIITRLGTNAGATKTQLGALEILTEKLGVEFYNADGTARDLNSVLMEAREAWKGLGDEQAISYAKTIAGQYAMSGWLAIMNAADEDVDKLTVALENATGAAEEMAKIRLDNLAGDITYLQSAFGTLQIVISDALNGGLREFVQFGTDAVKALTEGFKGNGVTGFMSALSGIVTESVTMLAEKAPEFVGVTMQFVQAMASGILAAKETLIVSANESFRAILSGFDSWLSQNEISLINFGHRIVNSIFNGFTNAGDVISEHIGNFVPLIANAFLSYHEALFSVGMDILGAIGQGIVDNKEDIQEIAFSAIAGIVKSLRENAPMIIDGAVALVDALVGAILENASYIAETAVEIVSKLASSIGQAAPDLIPAAVEAVLAFIEGLTNPESIKNLIDGALQLIEGLGKGIIKALPMLIAYGPEIVVSIVSGIISALPQLLEVGVQLIRGLVEGLIQGIVSIPEAIVKVVGAVVDGFKALFGIHSPSTVMAEMGVNLIDGLLQGISDTWQTIVDFFAGAGEALISFLGEVWGAIQEAASVAWEAVGGIVSAAWNAITGVWDAATGFFGDIWNSISGAFSAAEEVIGGAFKSAWNAVSGAWDGAISFFSEIWGSITGVFSNAWDAFSSIGGNIVEGIKNGISAAWTNLTNWVNGLFGNLISSVKKLLGIASPSKVFAGIGGNMALGLGQGWDNEYSAIKDKIEGGLDFGAVSVGLNANTTHGAQRTVPDGQQGGFGGSGDTYVTINSPVAVDAVQAAREWKKTTQRMAMGYV